MYKKEHNEEIMRKEKAKSIWEKKKSLYYFSFLTLSPFLRVLVRGMLNFRPITDFST